MDSLQAKLGKKGQLTIPKKIRERARLRENDVFQITQTPGGDIVIRKQPARAPEDQLLAFISKIPPFDLKKALQEIRKERDQDR